MTAMEVLKASKLFTSNTDIIRFVKQKGVKINGELVEDVNEVIEKGDFLNFVWFPHAFEFVKQHGLNLLIVAKGKSRVLLKVNGEDIEILES